MIIISAEKIAMINVKEKMKQDRSKASAMMKSKTDAYNLEVYSVASTLFGEAKDLDDKGIIRVAETIRNRYKFYNQNKVNGVSEITYRDIVSAPGQYLGFSRFSKKIVDDFKNFAQNLSTADRKKWDRCMAIAKQTVENKLQTNYAHGALGFNQASVERNKRYFKTDNVFKDDSSYVDDATKQSPHVFFGSCVISSLKTPQSKILARGGNPDEKKNVIAQNRILNSGRANTL